MLICFKKETFNVINIVLFNKLDIYTNKSTNFLNKVYSMYNLI